MFCCHIPVSDAFPEPEVLRYHLSPSFFKVSPSATKVEKLGTFHQQAEAIRSQQRYQAAHATVADAAEPGAREDSAHSPVATPAQASR